MNNPVNVKKPWRRPLLERGLFFKTTVSIIFIILISVSALTYVSIRRQSSTLKEELVEKNKTLADQISFAVRNAFYSLNWVYVEDMLKQSARSRDILWIRILKPDGEIYLSSGGEGERPTVDAPEIEAVPRNIADHPLGISWINEQVFSILKSTKIGKETWFVSMGISLCSIEDMKRKAIYEDLLWGALILLLGCLISLSLSRMISRPIVQLARAADSISEGDFDQQVDVGSTDEIAVLGRRFNEMAAKLSRFREELTESEETFRAISSSAQDAIVMLDDQAVITYWNQAAERIFRYSQAEALGKKGYDIFAPPRYRKEFGEALSQMSSTGKLPAAGRTFEFRAVRKGGEAFPAELSLSQVKLKGRWHAIGIMRDISTRKEAEERLKAYQQNLEHEVDERTRELKSAQQELVSNAMVAGMAQMSAVVLHNIGNAVTPMRVYLDIVKQGNTPRTVADLKKCHMDLSSHVHALSEYVNHDPRGRDVFAYQGKLIDALSRQMVEYDEILHNMIMGIDYVSEILTLQQGYTVREKEVKEQTGFNRLLEDALSMQKIALDKRRIQVKKNFSPELPSVLLDRNRIMQVAVNLIKNSYEAIGALGEKAPQKEIRLRTFTHLNKVGFEITDTGIGIKPGDIQGVFEFGKSGKGSSGFGLHYCRMFVEASAGSLEILSEGKGKGATVRVLFPC